MKTWKCHTFGTSERISDFTVCFYDSWMQKHHKTSKPVRTAMLILCGRDQKHDFLTFHDLALCFKWRLHILLHLAAILPTRHWFPFFEATSGHCFLMNQLVWIGETWFWTFWEKAEIMLLLLKPIDLWENSVRKWPRRLGNQYRVGRIDARCKNVCNLHLKHNAKS